MTHLPIKLLMTLTFEALTLTMTQPENLKHRTFAENSAARFAKMCPDSAAQCTFG